MKIKLVKNKMRGYVTLVVVIIFVPFLLLQGINLLNMGIDIVHISKNFVVSNNQYANEQTCWEEFLYFSRKNSGLPLEKALSFSNTNCDFSVQNLGEGKYKIVLNSQMDGYSSTSEKYVYYDGSVLKFVPSQ